MAEKCPMERCMYYDKTTQECYKIIYNTGPQNGLFDFNQARAACYSFGFRLVSITTNEKFKSLAIILRFITGTQQWARVQKSGVLKTPGAVCRSQGY
jgi:hypothetical protein